MKPQLIPQPQSIRFKKGFFEIPAHAAIGITDSSLHETAKKIGAFFRSCSVNISVPGVRDPVRLRLDASLKTDAYRLRIDRDGVEVDGSSLRAVFYGAQTLRQIMEQAERGMLPFLEIDDWPDFPDRGVCYCVAHGCVPEMSQLKRMVDGLSRYKINHLQLYHKHTFAFRGHPDIGRETSPLTADDILELDSYCLVRHVELVPALVSFGHMDPLLKHPQYHHLAEDWGVGKYVTEDKARKKRLEDWQKANGYQAYSLSPANPASYDFLDSLYAEFLPLFSSGRFNSGCDETYDLGAGQAYGLCKKLGDGRVYLNHIIKLNELCGKYGKKMMIWGDIIRHHPELVREIPKDITVLDWGYEHDHDFESIRDFKDAGLEFLACPSTASYRALYPSLPKAMANIAGFARAALRHGARGLLNTEWGDGGHYNFLEYSWHGLVFGAEQAWNTKASLEDFTARFCRDFVKTCDPRFVRALSDFGEINYPNNLWSDIYFANGERRIFPVGSRGAPVSVSLDGSATVFDAKRIREIHDVFAEHSGRSGEDPLKVLPYWMFSADTIAHAARKALIMSQPERNTLDARRGLAAEMRSLKTRFRKLWTSRYRVSEIRISLDAYGKAIKAIQRNKLADSSSCSFSYSPKIFASDAAPGAGWLAGLPYPEKKQDLAFRPLEFGTTNAGDGFYNMRRSVFSKEGRDEVVHLRLPLRCGAPMSLNVGVGYDGPVKVWIDRKEVFHDPAGTNPAVPDKHLIPFDFTEGPHEVMIALGSNNGNAWGVFLRFGLRASCSKNRARATGLDLLEFP